MIICKRSEVNPVNPVTPVTLSPLPGSRFNLADLSRTICSCYDIFRFCHLEGVDPTIMTILKYYIFLPIVSTGGRWPPALSITVPTPSTTNILPAGIQFWPENYFWKLLKLLVLHNKSIRNQPAGSNSAAEIKSCIILKHWTNNIYFLAIAVNSHRL